MQRLPFQFEAEISKVDEANRVVYATLLAPESRDLQGDIISLPEIQKAARYYMRESQVVGEMHTKEARAQTVESWVDDAGWHTATEIKDDAIWQKVMDGTYQGKSIGGYATSEPDGQGARLSNLEVDEYSIVTKPAVPEAKLRRKSDDGERDGERIVLFKSARFDDDETLAEKIRGGKVRRRVWPVKAIEEITEAVKGLLNKYAAGSGDDELSEADMERLDKLEAQFDELSVKLDTLSENVTKALAVSTETAKAEDAAGADGTADVEAIALKLLEHPTVKGLIEQGQRQSELLEKLAGKVNTSSRQKADAGEGQSEEVGTFDTSRPIRRKAYGE